MGWFVAINGAPGGLIPYAVLHDLFPTHELTDSFVSAVVRIAAMLGFERGDDVRHLLFHEDHMTLTEALLDCNCFGWTPGEA